MKKIFALIPLLLITLTACDIDTYINEIDYEQNPITNINTVNDSPVEYNGNNLPEFNGEPFTVMNNNIPFFTEDEIETSSFERYSELDELGRCQTAIACLSKSTAPKKGEKRGDIGDIKPAGWHTVKYPEVISDKYLYNRCHLIGWQLGAENDNPRNLTTGTRYLNVKGMLPFENMVDDYIEETDNHVMYRVTPVFVDDELVCRGILMEAKSIETDDIQFCVYCHNIQPGIIINYKTGDSDSNNAVS